MASMRALGLSRFFGGPHQGSHSYESLRGIEEVSLAKTESKTTKRATVHKSRIVNTIAFAVISGCAPDKRAAL
jgi:hypothetical protein